MNFQIQSLPAEGFQGLFELDDAELARRGAKRYRARTHPGYPCRVSLEDAQVGETVILLPFEHQAEATPFRASGPIYVRAGARAAQPGINEVPGLLRHRKLSVRAYDHKHVLRDADVVDGKDVEGLIERFFGQDGIAYLHIHYAGPGCYACRVDRP